MSEFQLTIRATYRPWWGLGLVTRWRESTWTPPPEKDNARDAVAMARYFREQGNPARVEVVNR